MKVTDDMLTGWHPFDVRPVHPGVYETRRDGFGILGYFAKWDGEVWLTDDDTKLGAAGSTRASRYQARLWRGLKQDPNGA